MRRSLLVLGLLCAGVSSPATGAPLVTEPFDYTAGASLIGQSPAVGFTWGSAAIATADDLVINATSMSPTPPYTLPAGFPTPSGGSVTYGGVGRTYVLPTGTINSGTTYYSMLVSVSDLGALTGTTAGIMAGLANATVGGSNPTVLSALFGRPGSVAGTYQLGISRNSNPANASFGGDLPLGDTVFVVASYEFVTGTQNDIANLWINPSPADFGAAVPPAPTLTGLNTGNDSSITSFVLYQRGSSSAQFGAAGESADELRIGSTWADVTPIPEPATMLGMLTLSGAMLAGRRRG